MNFKMWWRGLLAAVINAAVMSLSAIFADPTHFNLFEQAGVVAIGKVALMAAISGALLYLKTHPLPNQDELDVMQEKVVQKAEAQAADDAAAK